MWRKTRSLGRLCTGVDPNRNYDFHWGGPGASEFQCSEAYQGPKPFSEPETLSHSRFLEKYSNQIKLYLTFHSYGTKLLYPWSYTRECPDDADELDGLAIKVGNVIRAVRGTKYEVGNSATIEYLTAGSSDDWAKGVAGIQLSYTIELPGGGKQGFDLPASEILNVVQEMFEGVKVWHNYIETKFSQNV